MTAAIRVQNLSKRYQIRHGDNASYATLRDEIMHVATKPLRWLRGQRPPPTEEFWALKDVSFEVQPGEIVGVIGRNGAGKSTLLKILSRITKPTAGRVEMRGRVGSLLEVGTGFHPELTGRENIFLSGAILGMKRAEIARRFNEIVGFSGIEMFLDTPVKRYSSGMYVRLAFSVAASLESDILIVDEVLAVGDAEFQKKCLGRIGRAAIEGRTILFVSHNLAAVTGLCDRAMLFQRGQLIKSGTAKEICKHYDETITASAAESMWPDPRTAPGNNVVRIHSVRVLQDNRVTADVRMDRSIQVEISYWNMQAGTRISVGLAITTDEHVCVLSSANRDSASLGRDEWFNREAPIGLYTTRCEIPGNLLNEGRYLVTPKIFKDITDVQATVAEAICISVIDTGEMRREFFGAWDGVIRPKLAWSSEYREQSA